MDTEQQAEARSRLRAASARHAKLRAAVVELRTAIVEAAQVGLTPTDIVNLSDFTKEGTRKVLRRYGVPPAQPGNRSPRHAASAASASASSTGDTSPS